MKKVINKLRDKDLDVLVLILILVSVLTLMVVVDSNDELWNFANCYKMFNGYKIYKELNVIVTPLFFYIAQLFFKIFGTNILAFRIYNIVISTAFLMLIYFIFKSLKIIKRRAILYTFVMFYIFSSMLAAGANYNLLAFVPILIAILLIIKEKANNIYLGILLFLTFMLKQNIFVYFAIGLFVYKLLNRDNIKKIFFDLLKIYLTALVGITVFLIYMYLENNLYNFINFCFLGISEFGENNLYIDAIGARYLYISIIAIIFSLIMIYNKKINKNMDTIVIKNTKCLLSFGIPLLLVCFPIGNYYHATLSSSILFVELIYVFESILIKNLEIKRKIEKNIYFIIFLIYIMYLSIILVVTVKEIRQGNNIFNTEGVFCGSIISKEDNDDIRIICEYIRNKENDNIDVKVLYHRANLYMINLNKNNGIFDLAFLGNLGIGGENELINQIKNLDNTLILIQKDEEKIYWQESRRVRENIVKNYEKIGEIQEYSIYNIER